RQQLEGNHFVLQRQRQSLEKVASPQKRTRPRRTEDRTIRLPAQGTPSNRLADQGMAEANMVSRRNAARAWQIAQVKGSKAVSEQMCPIGSSILDRQPV